MKKKDQILLEEAYQKIIEASPEVRNQYGDIEDVHPDYRTAPTREQEQERERQSSWQQWETDKQKQVIATFKDPKQFLERYNNSNPWDKKELNLTAQSTPDQIVTAAEQLAKKYITNPNDRMYLGLHRLGDEVSNILKQQAKGAQTQSKPVQTQPTHKIKPFKPQSRFQKLMGKIGFGK
jgi:hypothetical protein